MDENRNRPSICFDCQRARPDRCEHFRHRNANPVFKCEKFLPDYVAVGRDNIEKYLGLPAGSLNGSRHPWEERQARVKACGEYELFVDGSGDGNGTLCLRSTKSYEEQDDG